MRPSLPPGPRAPGPIQALRWSTRVLQFMERCAARYGDMFTLRGFNGQPYVVFHDPRGHEQVFTADTKVLRTANRLLAPVLGYHSLLLLNGPRHRRERRLMTPPFHGARMRLYAELIAETTERTLAQAEQRRDPTIGIHELFRAISLEVILRAVFGIETARVDEAANILTDATDSFSSLLLFIPPLQRDLGPGSPGRRFQAAMRRAHAFLSAEIDARRADPRERHDILSMLIAARDEHGQPMTDEEIRDELMTLTIAGHETTATALAWAVHWIHRSPAVRRRLVGVLDALGPDPAPESFARTPYLMATCDETMRRTPVVPNLGRYAKHGFRLLGRELPPETLIVPCTYLTHMRADIYPQPRVFRPERFLGHKFSPFEYLPFGGGSRRCLGAAFALFEMRLVLGILLRRYRVESLDRRTVPVRRMVVVAPRRETPVRLFPRPAVHARQPSGDDVVA